MVVVGQAFLFSSFLSALAGIYSTCMLSAIPPPHRSVAPDTGTDSELSLGEQLEGGSGEAEGCSCIPGRNVNGRFRSDDSGEKLSFAQLPTPAQCGGAGAVRMMNRLCCKRGGRGLHVYARQKC
jgi:hypothetical protein